MIENFGGDSLNLMTLTAILLSRKTTRY